MDCERLEELGAAAWQKEEPSSSDRRISKSRLHNFSLPTASWGNQRLLRCMKPVMGNSGSGLDRRVPGVGQRIETGSASLHLRRLGKEDQGKALLRSEIGEIGQRKKFFVSLSREEIEEDFYVFKGTKPCRRPKKRARIVERQLEALFPGLWLSEVTMDTYKLVD
ncbi:hypothetical protein HPP92_000219 [Vanilla planifolia]|uniref:DUF1639 family protein n=1 Tax=Vanilla planifolia TaxID=51239 RepID=A0A835SAT8_VANPL|nr:hypothetical protein HPP92_000219 [Vanilla planifolia]